jgi:hypothetical protein
MLRLLLRTCVVALIPALVGCVNTLQPLSTADVRVDLPKIEGDWTIADTTALPSLDQAGVKIERRSTGIYDLTLTEDDQKSHWRCQTAKLGTTTFVDLVPLLDAVEEADQAAEMLTLAAHLILAVEHSDDEIRLFGFDHSKLDPLVVEQGLAIDSATNHRLLYVARTEKLQAFFRTTGAKYLQRSLPVLVLKRKKS